MIRNEYKKLTEEDKFARKYYCQRARLNSVRNDKRENKRKMRRYNKKLIREELDGNARMD